MISTLLLIDATDEAKAIAMGGDADATRTFTMDCNGLKPAFSLADVKEVLDAEDPKPTLSAPSSAKGRKSLCSKDENIDFLVNLTFKCND